MKISIGIDASNIGEGGGVTHLIELLNNLINKFNTTTIKGITVFSSQKVLNKLPDSNFIKKITFPGLNKGLLFRVLFQITQYDKEIKKHCDILFSISGDYLGKFKPVVGMSQNMLLYERDIWKEIKQPKEIIRFWLNFQKQKRCFKNASGIIFISGYAQSEVAKQINLHRKEITKIHHGISSRFIGKVKPQKEISQYSLEMPFRFLYVSTVHVYKHQWNVIEAVGNLRQKGYPVELDLVGGTIFSPAGKMLEDALNKIDYHEKFIRYHGHISYEEIDTFYKNSNGIIYASTCENMPNILIESMASGIPIACSDKQPMPEFLKDNGFYFDAKNSGSIEKALVELLLQPKVRVENATKCLEEVKNYSWAKTTEQTMKFIEKIYKEYNHV